METEHVESKATKDMEPGAKRPAAIAHLVAKLRASYGGLDELALGEIVDLAIFAHLLVQLPLADAVRAYQTFKAQFVDWNDVRISSAKEVQDVVKEAKEPLEVAIFLKGLLNRLFTERHHVSLEFLREATLPDARAFFKKSPGYADSTVQLLLALVKELPVFPIESWMYPMVARLGLVHKEKTTHLQQQKELYEKIARDRLLEAYALLLEHARRTCLPEEGTMDCPGCVVRRSCPHPHKTGARSKRKQ